MLKPLDMAHQLLAEIVEAEDLVVDATMGNGWDTAFLAELSHHVYAFDVQEVALHSTKKRLAERKLKAELILDGHENMALYIKAPIKAAIFNLGYLPRADKSVITKPETTIQALEYLTTNLQEAGRIMVLVYHGHEGGKQEREVLLQWVARLPQSQWQVMKYMPVNQINNPPFLIAIEKR